MLLSKSKYLNGLQCLKYLWILLNAPEQVAKVDASTQFRFDQGHQVGELAKKLFPTGINVPNDNFNNNITQTNELLKQRQILFEAGIKSADFYSRVDILIPVDKYEWDIIEVKSSTEVKNEHIQDASFQRFCCEKNGLKIRNCHIAYINNKYVRQGDIDSKQIFKIQDITREVNGAVMGIEDRVDNMLEVMSSLECPNMLIGIHCNTPYPCPVSSCQELLPDNTILELYWGGKKKYELFHDGILFIKDIPNGTKLNNQQKIQKWCDERCEPYVDEKAIEGFIATLEYPLSFLDFETFDTAIPLFDGIRPYQKVPFQFSLHVLKAEKSDPLHWSFLASSNEDPRLNLLSELSRALPDKGSVVVYNQSFEKKVLTELGEAFIQYRNWTNAVCNRLVDLMSPFKNFHYYNPVQRGSASMKEVLPAVTGKGYEGMPIAKGDDASLAYLKLAFAGSSYEEKEQTKKDLEEYCGLDTEGMVWIVRKLNELQ